VSGGNITAPASPADRESAMTTEEQAKEAAPAEEQSRMVAEADHERAEAAAVNRDPGEHCASATAEDQDPGQHQAEATTEPDIWLEDDADVHDPDID
jgi:hypothetical protein